MSLNENKQLLQRFFDAGNRGDMDACMALFSDNIVWTNMGSTSLSGTYQGKQELGEKLLGPLFGQLKAGIHMTVTRMTAEDNRVVAECEGKAETLDGRAYNNRYCWVATTENGKIIEITEYLDTQLAAEIFA